jgi:hypothetical protein
MVAVSVGLVVSGLVIVNYNTYNTTQVLKQAALTIKNYIRFIQTKASSGEKPTAGCTTLTGWDMTFSQSSYSYRPNCDGVPTGVATTIYLPSGVTISSLPSQNPITFFVLARGTNLDSATTITLSGSGKQYGIQIGNNGEISDIGIQ